MHPLIKTVLQRLGLGLITLFVVSLIIFSAIEFLPGDFAKSILGQSATPETVAAFQREIGLDRPATVRYMEWIGGVIHGDFGLSFASRAGLRRSVAELIAPRLLNTLFLAGVTAVIAVPLALFLGVLAALHRESWFDRGINAVTLTAISFPEFFVAYILMLFLAVKFPIFHSLANINAEMGGIESLKRIALPVLTLTLVIVAHMMRMTRSAIISLLGSPYVEMAQLKGASPTQIVLGHVLPNAWAPIANVIAFNLAYLVVGIVVVEVVFVYPGIGQATVDAVRSRDIPVVQAAALIFASTYILLNLMADVIAVATNPRLLHPK
ncbi:MAG: ABC transporter permease [Mesorhizobium sp.]|nr:MAG: ABC transporter permease [Mesorhizobium sp.]